MSSRGDIVPFSQFCIQSALVAFALSGPQVFAAGVTFTDIAQDAASGITYSRVPSANFSRYLGVLGTPLSFVGANDLPQKSRGAPGVAVFDFDLDGDEDIYVTNGPGAPNSLYSNQWVETGQVTFVDVALEAGVDATAIDCSGVAFGDLDNDGDKDLLVMSVFSPNILYENNGDGTFSDISLSSGIGLDNFHSSGAALGDVNGDGLLDIFIGNTFDWDVFFPVNLVPYFLSENNQLFLNQGDNVFVDVSASSGIQVLDGFDPSGFGSAGITWGVAMVDYDMDGDLDIFNEDDQAAIPPASFGGVDRGLIHLHRNDGAGNFSDVTVQAGLDNHGAWMGLTFADFNCDGHLDFFNTNFSDYNISFFNQQPTVGFQQSRWYLGQADGTFLDPGLGDLGATPFGWGTSALDYDNDGDTDIVFHGGLLPVFVVEMSNPGTILDNDGNANFSYDDIALAGSTNHQNRTVIGVATGDFDNNGYDDIVSASSFNIPEDSPFIFPNPFADLFGGTGPFDGISRFYAAFFQTGPDEFVLNPDWLNLPNGTLSVELNNAEVGHKSISVETVGTLDLTSGGGVNRDGIGAIVTVTPRDGFAAMRPVVGGSSHQSQDSLVLNFGLADARRAHVDIFWPGGVRNRLHNVKANKHIVFPEIPCSFDGDWPSFRAYRSCVRTALNELVTAGVIAPNQKGKFFSSAVRAFREAQ